MADYEERIETKSLLITPVNSSLLLSVEDLKDAFGDVDLHHVYISFFQQEFEDILTRISSFSEIRSNVLAESVNLRTMEFVIPKRDTTYFYVPTDKNIADSQDKAADFILFISRLEVVPSWIDIEFTEKPNVRHNLYYLFWDNQQAKTVCFGRAEYTDGAKTIDKATFELWIDNLAKSFIENTPFPKKRNQW